MRSNIILLATLVAGAVAAPMAVEPAGPFLRRDKGENPPEVGCTTDEEVGGKVSSIGEFTFDSDKMTWVRPKAARDEKTKVC